MTAPSFRVSMLLALLVAFLAAPAARADDDLTDEAVREAIRRGIDYIYKQQNQWGHWEEGNNRVNAKGNASRDWSGRTSIAAYALLAAGEEWQNNQKLMKALRFLAKEEEGRGTYAIGLRAHVWPKLPDESSEINFFDELREDTALLVNGINPKGAYHYVLGQSSWDNSCTQYGGLGVWEAAKRGVPIRDAYWKAIEDHFVDVQNTADGGWGYKGPTGSRMTMTAAGLAMLYVTLDYLHRDDFRRAGVADNHPIIERINLGLEYFDKNYKPTTDGYEAVGIERVGLASGRKFFNNQDWYRTTAARFINSQKESGQLGGGGHGGGVVNTSFALIFLSRGRVPVFANKLEVPDAHWNNRPRDLAHLTKWASDQFEQDMNWQVISIERQPTDWLDAPILYIASHQPLDLTDKQWQKLKAYVDRGGLIVTTADDGSAAFTRSVQQGFENLYPYEFQQLDDADPLANIVYPLDRTRVTTLHNGVRHLVLHIPYDVSGMFQVNNQDREEHWQLFANAFQYAIGKAGAPRPRLEKHFIEKQGRARRTVEVARVQHEGNWDPEPAAWSQLDIFATNNANVGFNTYPVSIADLPDSGRKFAHLAGVGATSFSDEQAKALRRYVLNGGFLTIEAVGGDAAFAAAIREMLGKAFPDQRLRLVSGAHPIVTGEEIDGAFDNSSIDYRRFYKQRLGGGFMSRPQLLAVEIDGEPRVVVAYEDLSMGMVGAEAWGVFGYDIDSARRIMTNIALYADTATADAN